MRVVGVFDHLAEVVGNPSTPTFIIEIGIEGNAIRRNKLRQLSSGVIAVLGKTRVARAFSRGRFRHGLHQALQTVGKGNFQVVGGHDAFDQAAAVVLIGRCMTQVVDLARQVTADRIAVERCRVVVRVRV